MPYIPYLNPKIQPEKDDVNENDLILVEKVPMWERLTKAIVILLIVSLIGLEIGILAYLALLYILN